MVASIYYYMHMYSLNYDKCLILEGETYETNWSSPLKHFKVEGEIYQWIRGPTSTITSNSKLESTQWWRIESLTKQHIGIGQNHLASMWSHIHRSFYC